MKVKSTFRFELNNKELDELNNVLGTVIKKDIKGFDLRLLLKKANSTGTVENQIFVSDIMLKRLKDFGEIIIKGTRYDVNLVLKQ